MKPKDRAKEQKKLKGRCDKVWAQLVRDAAKGRCEMCGKPGAHAHHMIGRHQSFTRHDLRNGVYLCVSCHMRFHNTESHSCWVWFEVTRNADYAWCIQHKHTLGKGIDFVDVYERLLKLREMI